MEEETEQRRFSLHRLVHYCLDLAELNNSDRLVPVVIFLGEAALVPTSLTLGTEYQPYLTFDYLSCKLKDIPYERWQNSDNLVARLNLPNMKYPAVRSRTRHSTYLPIVCDGQSRPTPRTPGKLRGPSGGRTTNSRYRLRASACLVPRHQGELQERWTARSSPATGWTTRQRPTFQVAALTSSTRSTRPSRGAVSRSSQANLPGRSNSRGEPISGDPSGSWRRSFLQASCRATFVPDSTATRCALYRTP